MLASLRARGVYDPPNGPSIRARDFKGVYIVGNGEPLTWDFTALQPGSRFELTDPNRDGIYTVTLPFETMYTRPTTGEKGGSMLTICDPMLPSSGIDGAVKSYVDFLYALA